MGYAKDATYEELSALYSATQTEISKLRSSVDDIEEVEKLLSGHRLDRSKLEDMRIVMMNAVDEKVLSGVSATTRGRELYRDGNMKLDGRMLYFVEGSSALPPRYIKTTKREGLCLWSFIRPSHK